MSKRLLHSIIVLSLFPCLSCGVETTKTDSTIPSFNSKLKSKAKNMIPSVECSDTDTLLVTLNENVKNAKETVFSTFDDNAVTDLTTSITDDCKKVYSVDLSGFSYDDINKAVSDLESKDEVYYIEKDNPIPIADSTEPDDPYYSSSQWGLNGTYGINAPNAWKFTTGSSSVRVGVIDTGVAKHTDLNANLVDGYDFVADSADGSKDLNGHGTHVAGIIGAVGNNSIGVTGVNWNTSIVSLQASNDGTRVIKGDAAIKAINYAISLWGTEDQIDIINYSVSGYGYDISIREVARNFPGLFVWSAGNLDVDIDSFLSGCDSFDLPNIISVGAINSVGNKSDFSNYSLSGDNVSIYAPGDNILSTIPDNKYGYKSGTSMAAPFVSGTAALLLAENPDLSASQLKNLILNSANSTNITYSYDNNTVSHTVKSLNAYAALSAAHTTHKYTYKYVVKNSKQHFSYCRCGAYKLQSHAVSSSDTGVSKKTCIFCGASVSTGLMQYGTVSIASLYDEKTIYFGNGSYVLPNGIYVISDEDLDAVLNGILALPE